jgi:hypothetical protein
VSLSSCLVEAVEGWSQVDLTKFGGRMPKRWELKVVEETAQRRNLRGTLRAMARLQRKKAKEATAVKRGNQSSKQGKGTGSGGIDSDPGSGSALVPAGGGSGGGGGGPSALIRGGLSMPTQEDVLEPLRFSGPMQKVHEFSASVPAVDLTRHYAPDGTCSSTVLQTYYSSE